MEKNEEASYDQWADAFQRAIQRAMEKGDPIPSVVMEVASR